MTQDRSALDAAFQAAYAELRRLAAHMQHRDSAVTFDPTGLVNAAWLKLASTPAVADTTPLHFKRIAARAMRQVLVESARRRQADKRGGGTSMMITLDEQVGAQAIETEILALHQALEDLAALHPRPAAVVEARYFGGLTNEETATALGISEATVSRDWRTARAWLASELSDWR
ncbi:MAG TPA: ECF-type sigma factor [Gemmatimonadales bacterium]|nr:ECF-type sigma factor [Gemmatimonadales bacterium]